MNISSVDESSGKEKVMDDKDMNDAKSYCHLLTRSADNVTLNARH